MAHTLLNLLNLTPQNSHTLLEFVRQRFGLADESASLFECQRYEAIAQAFVAVEQGSEQPFHLWVVTNWAAEYFQAKDAERTAEQQRAKEAAAKPPPFSQVRTGKVGNPRYQAYLDTLEQEELDKLTNNVGYFTWINEAERLAAQRKCSIDEAIATMRTERLSQRVRATLSKGG